MTCFITGGGGGEMFFICFWSVVVEGEVGRLQIILTAGSSASILSPSTIQIMLRVPLTLCLAEAQTTKTQV